MTGGFVPGGSTWLPSNLLPSGTVTPPITIIFGTAGGWPLDGHAKTCGYSSTGCQTVKVNRENHDMGTRTYRIEATVSRQCNRLHGSFTSFIEFWYARPLRE